MGGGVIDGDKRTSLSINYGRNKVYSRGLRPTNTAQISLSFNGQTKGLMNLKGRSEQFYLGHLRGATTLSMTAISIMTGSVMTLFSRAALSIKI
jgi:hypothetical protein